ncbi:MAG: hypothetical protein ABL982_00180 [Vicinamibacterales bacterium]
MNNRANECKGHPAGEFDPLGETVYCDGTCVPAAVIDFSVARDFSLALLRPLTGDAQGWLQQHVAADATYFGDALVVEHRYLLDLLDGISGDGLTFTQE